MPAFSAGPSLIGSTTTILPSSIFIWTPIDPSGGSSARAGPKATRATARAVVTIRRMGNSFHEVGPAVRPAGVEPTAPGADPPGPGRLPQGAVIRHSARQTRLAQFASHGI